MHILTTKTMNKFLEDRRHSCAPLPSQATRLPVQEQPKRNETQGMAHPVNQAKNRRQQPTNGLLNVLLALVSVQQNKKVNVDNYLVQNSVYYN